MNIKDTILSKFPILMEPALLDEMARYCTTKTLEAGNNFIEIGDDVVAMPLLTKGVIKVVREDSDGNELLLYYLNGGDTCASTLSCCMERAKSEVRATVIETVTAIMVPINCMEDWMKKYAGWRSFIMQSYRMRFEELLHTIDSIAFKKMDERLIEYLIQLSEERNTLVLLGTHQEIADDLHTSREVISRLLKQLEKLGKISLSRNKIEIVDLS
ncbi:Crp/Fnr family transcriptional regulator [Carboxylicivirga sediminis]|uniref:Crp/Fnr family transcriptional regulator n=1 Tax=Carboxylicivirga sediminis TaxID=2006564 RepID=A0A941FAW6_9BACT|nr:Crp/Fnr family transcriptional regulator [Carboxylicivirga sediminis]MBR8537740.1 Crp/Fnr family transcriptional regulator [Carboxylicivirga sediminis]